MNDLKKKRDWAGTLVVLTFDLVSTVLLSAGSVGMLLNHDPLALMVAIAACVNASQFCAVLIAATLRR